MENVVQESLDTVQAVVKAKLRDIVEREWEGWEGTIRCVGGFVFDVSLECKERPKLSCEPETEPVRSDG